MCALHVESSLGLSLTMSLYSHQLHYNCWTKVFSRGTCFIAGWLNYFPEPVWGVWNQISRKTSTAGLVSWISVWDWEVLVLNFFSVFNFSATWAATFCPRGIIHNPPHPDMDYRIFNVLTWSFVCVPPEGRWGDFWCFPPVLNLKAASLIPLFYISSLVLLPSPVAISVLSSRREAGGFLMSPPCLESQGFQFDSTFLYLLSCSSA